MLRTLLTVIGIFVHYCLNGSKHDSTKVRCFDVGMATRQTVAVCELANKCKWITDSASIKACRMRYHSNDNHRTVVAFKPSESLTNKGLTEAFYRNFNKTIMINYFSRL